MKPIILLEAGHGGYDLVKRINYTNPKNGKFFIHQDGTAIYEGEFNRAIVKRLITMLEGAGLQVINIVPEIEDISLSERVKRINALQAKHKNCIHYSIHANAATVDPTKKPAHGLEVLTHTSPSPKSVKMAECLKDAYDLMLANQIRFRGVKGQNLHMCRETHTPSVLIENPFMTNYDETKTWLLSEQGRDKLANWIFQGITKYTNAF